MSTLTFTLLQQPLVWEDKTANIQHFSSIINNLQQHTEVVVLPEMFSTGFSMRPEVLAETMDGPTVTWMRSTAAEKKIILTGSVMIEENGLYHNRLIWMLPNGEYGYYDKKHCFGYAGEDKHYTPGNKRLIASVKGWRINLQICYDLRFPVWARQQQHDGPEYDVLLYVANWPERRNHAWKTLLQARAIENQCYVIGVNRVGRDGNDIYHSGDSMVVDAMGAVLYEKAHGEDVYTITLEKQPLEETRSKLPFLKDADNFTIHHG
ncbi:MAG TPA: amidohydrolase [Chitinophagaceae bacterium]|nr:amidohydrolase [Chitinophagaceae bacterium]HCT23437.1 amidohydrolase [Chitinophagaceae bacterium]